MGNNASDNFSDFDEFDFGTSEDSLLHEVSAATLELDTDEFLEQNGATIYIYVVGEAKTSFYRIGHTICPQLQRAKIQVGNPRKLIYKSVLKLQLVKKKRGAFFKLKALAECIEATINKELADFRCEREGPNSWFEFNIGTKPILYDVFKNKTYNIVNLNKNWVTVEAVPKKR